MKKITLKAEARTLLGRKVKQLRKQNLLPANVFGKNVTSLALQILQIEFLKVHQEAGATGLVDLEVAGGARPVLIHQVQLHPVTGLPLHVDFYQVDLKQKIKAHVPLEFIGSAPAVEQKLGVLLKLIDEVEVESLPTNLPEKLTVDVSKLAQVGESIKVGQLPITTDVLILTSAETEIAKIGALITKEAEQLAAQEAAAKAAQAAETATTTPTTTEGASKTAPVEKTAEVASPEAKPEAKK